MNRTIYTFLLVLISLYSRSQITLNETMGTVSATTAISTHQNNGGFAQGQWNYSGNADVRATSASPGGGANIFITTTPGQFFRLDGLSGTGCTTLELQFRIWKNGGVSNPLTITEFLVQTSSDGITFSEIDWGGHNLGGVWIQTGVLSIPVNTIAIRFTQPVAPDQQVRIDDVTIIGSGPCTEPLLPVNFIDFTIKKADKKLELEFTTASEVNNDYFSIERSEDGKDFSEIGRLKGLGNTNFTYSYLFTDDAPRPGINYYRIKQHDFDGNYMYSEVQSEYLEKEGDVLNIEIYNSEVRISSEKEDLTLVLYKITGQQMGKYNVSSGHQSFDISFLIPGTYILCITDKDGVTAKKFIKM